MNQFPRKIDSVKRSLLAALAVLTAVVFGALPAAAEDNWPSRPIRLIVPFAAGGPSDLIGRLLADGLSRELKQSVVVDNKPGGGASIGAAAAARAAPDGYTLLVGHAAAVSFTPQMRKVDYDPIKDFAPIAALSGNFTLLAARKDLPARNMAELKALALTKPEAVSCGTAGMGSGSHIVCQKLAEAFGARFLVVHYKGLSEATTDLLAGRIDIMFDPSSLPHIRSGAAKALAGRGKNGTRNPEVPDVASFAEQGYPTISDEIWAGLLAPAKTPAAIVTRLAAAIEKIATAPETGEKLIRAGSFPQFIPAEELRPRIVEEFAEYGRIIQKLGLKTD